ncbi:conserved hypothetical protein [Ricinus communis]|uniref:Uncharacterized protein n=1 Tax=Ricinus communis TaxID=3988 RepID=B9T7L9_RICCO|nr:conserved hypothetical protein [Ricinus communis]
MAFLYGRRCVRLGTTLSKALTGLFMTDHRNCMIKDYVHDNGTWNWKEFSQFLPLSLMVRIAACLPVMGGLWRYVWKWDSPQGIRMFLWLVVWEKLLTNVECHKRHLTNDTSCARCSAANEDVLHALRDCPKVKRILFGVSCWRLWAYRNNEALGNKKIDGWFLVRDIYRRTEKVVHMVNLNIFGVSRIRSEVLIRWKSPPQGWYKLNTDGAVKGNVASYARGIIRNNKVFGAELWGVHYGILMAWEIGIQQLIIKVDNKSVIKAIKGMSTNSYGYNLLINNIKQVMHRPWKVIITHVYKEANRAADA